MRLQKKRSVIERTKFSSGSKVSSLMDDLELREMEAYENENYCETFILQFSFLELKIESIIRNFSKIAGSSIN